LLRRGSERAAGCAAGQGQLTTVLHNSQLKKHLKVVEMPSTPYLQVFQIALMVKCRYNTWGCKLFHAHKDDGK